MSQPNPKSQDTELEAPDAMELLVAAKKGGMHGAYAYGLLHSLIAAHDNQRRAAVLAAIGPNELQYPDPPDSHERRAGRNGLRNELRPKVNAIYGTEDGES